MKWLAALSSLVLTLASCGQSTFTIVPSPARELVDGVNLVKCEVGGAASCKVTMITFTEAKHTIRILSQSERHRQGARLIDAIAASTNAIAACNGGYFHPHHMLPANLEICDGKRTGTYGSSSSIDSGAVLAVRHGQMLLQIEKDFTLTDDLTQMVQCGPMLVKNGVSSPGTGEVAAQRTFILTDGAGRWAIGTTTSLSLPKLARLLAHPKLLPNMSVKWAMNLDGGPSTGLWWRDAKGATGGEREVWPVRNLVTLVPREPMK
jgi:hypothetical protein